MYGHIAMYLDLMHLSKVCPTYPYVGKRSGYTFLKGDFPYYGAKVSLENKSVKMFLLYLLFKDTYTKFKDNNTSQQGHNYKLVCG